MPSPSRSFSHQMGHIPDACLVDHDSIPRRTLHWSPPLYVPIISVLDKSMATPTVDALFRRGIPEHLAKKLSGEGFTLAQLQQLPVDCMGKLE
jgi:hypothetical protein